MFFAPFFWLFVGLIIAPCASVTLKEYYLPGHVQKTIFDVDWMGCLQACHDEPTCISYNYRRRKKTCEINSDGLKDECDNKRTVFSKGWTFHQIRVSAI